MCSSDLGDLNGATAHFFKALEINPNYAEAQNSLGVALARQGRLKEAIYHFKEALRLSPDYAKARTNLAIALQEAGKTAEMTSSGSTP